MNLETDVVRKKMVSSKVMLQVDLYPNDKYIPPKKILVDVYTNVASCLVQPGNKAELKTLEKKVVAEPVILGIVCQACANCGFLPEYSGEPDKCGAYYNK